MQNNTFRHMLKPIGKTGKRLEKTATDHPAASIAGALAVIAVIGFGYWIWPELHRTIRIHRM